MISREQLLNIVKKEEMAQSCRDYYYLRPGEIRAAIVYGVAKIIEINTMAGPGKYYHAVEIQGAKFVSAGAPILIDAKYLMELR